MVLNIVDKFEDNFVETCFEVMNDIHKDMDIVQNDDGTINEQNYMISFAYLLGVKLGKIDYKVGGELKKEIIIDDEKVKELVEKLRNTRIDENLTEVNIKPDFVIHRFLSRDEMNDENQRLIIETKTTRQLNQDHFNWDLYKLSAYINQLAYKVGIYIIVNENKNHIDRFLDGYTRCKLPEITIPYNRKLYFLIQGKDKSNPEAYLFT